MGRAIMDRLVWSRALEEKIIELADNGLGNIEIAEIVGTTRSAIENRLRKIGYRRTGEQKSEVYKRAAVKHGALPPHKTLEEREADFAAKFSNREELANLEYVSGYVSGDCNVRLRCKVCGHEFTRWTKKVARKSNPVTFCPQCAKQARMKREPRRRHVLRTRSCGTCGKAFMASGREVYCSPECYMAANKKQIKERSKRLGLNDCIRRARHYGVAYEYGITLDKLISRDGNTCHLCGGECDKSDKRFGHVGPLYPTIDHVVPLSKGGTHTWGNVRLAHFSCNSAKSARTGEEEIREAVSACAANG